MILIENQPRFAIPGGGSGPISIEDDLLNHSPNVDAITPVSDLGGHSLELRTVLGVCAPGDTSHRLAVRIRGNPLIRELLTYRHPENGHRAGNHLVATAEKITGSHSAGAELIEEAFRAHIVGRVIPCTDQNDVQLRIKLRNGEYIIGEGDLDKRRPEHPNIVDMEFVAKRQAKTEQEHYEIVHPDANPKAIDSIMKADVVVIPPGTWHGSIRPVIDVSGIAAAIRETEATIVWFCNTCDFLNWPPDKYLQNFVEIIGRGPDFAFLDTPQYSLPQSYIDQGMSFVPHDEEHLTRCTEYARHVEALPMTDILPIQGAPTIRHLGEITSPLLMNIATTHRLGRIAQQRGLHANGNGRASLTLPR